MRVTIDIDAELMAEAMAATGLSSQKATVEEGLRRLVSRRDQKNAVAALKGMGWDGDFEAMREGRNLPTLK